LRARRSAPARRQDRVSGADAMATHGRDPRVCREGRGGRGSSSQPRCPRSSSSIVATTKSSRKCDPSIRGVPMKLGRAARSRRQSAVHPAAAVRHGWRLAPAFFPGTRPIAVRRTNRSGVAAASPANSVTNAARFMSQPRLKSQCTLKHSAVRTSFSSAQNETKEDRRSIRPFRTFRAVS
jgi:hypothetical protein